MMRRILALVVCLQCFLIPAAVAEEAFYTTSDGMAYNCLFFQDEWPDAIKADMEKCFPDAEIIDRGIYYLWHPMWGDDTFYVFAAVEANGQRLLVGAEQKENGW